MQKRAHAQPSEAPAGAIRACVPERASKACAGVQTLWQNM